MKSEVRSIWEEQNQNLSHYNNNYEYYVYGACQLTCSETTKTVCKNVILMKCHNFDNYVHVVYIVNAKN